MHDRKTFQYEDWLVGRPKEKGRMKGSISSGSTDTKGSFSRESDKYLFPGASYKHGNGGSRQKGLASDDNFLQDDARSPLEKLRL